MKMIKSRKISLLQLEKSISRKGLDTLNFLLYLRLCPPTSPESIVAVSQDQTDTGYLLTKAITRSSCDVRQSLLCTSHSQVQRAVRGVLVVGSDA
ncbi:hypothetical protein RvY_08720 [Ramazzottius varieornatus]|uniref:Uncharacterized protein n=1 Tax=Ramazzottius varieornatus TaxID=947166 RepID=A0A1D1VG13_RAMVA|nr:hypothetical protein RvY_08720 [Ramazzottius varieornatus]